MNEASGQLNPSQTEIPAYIVLSQNNSARKVTVREVSPAAAELLGRDVKALEGVDFLTILGKKGVEAIADYLEFEEGASDLDDVLGRLQDFRLKHSNGEEIRLAAKFVRGPAQDQNHWFRLILKDERRQIKESSLRSIIHDNLAGVRSLHEETGLPDRHSCMQYLEMIRNYVKSHDLDVCFAVLRIDRYEKSLNRYGRGPCLELIQHVVRCCRSKFREEDVICRLSDSTLGLFLLDIKPESVRVVLNRLRWFISSHRIAFGGKPDFSVTVSIAFASVKQHLDDKDLIQLVEKEAAAIPMDERNVLVEVP